MAQPTIYADIDCDGQVEVKVNNDTGYDCNIITNTGVNETIPSTGTDVYRNYNLTSSDWVKVVGAQDVTIAANKLTGTIKYITSATTTPTPTTTPAPTTTSTTTTPAGGGATPLSCGGSCATPSQITAIGIANKYSVNLTTTECWYEINLPKATWSTKKIYINSGTDLVTRNLWNSDNCKFAFNTQTASTWPSGIAISSMTGALSNNTTFRFAFSVPSGTASYEFYIDN
jgi:hypothetical protein